VLRRAGSFFEIAFSSELPLSGRKSLLTRQVQLLGFLTGFGAVTLGGKCLETQRFVVIAAIPRTFFALSPSDYIAICE
jgi:hypothetical protein